MTANPKLRVLYVTHPYSRVGALCLKGIVDHGETVVGVVIPSLLYRSGTLFGSVFKLAKRRGLPFAALVISRVLVSMLRTKLRSWKLLPKVFQKTIWSASELMEMHSLPLYRPSNLESPEFLAAITNLKPDLIIVGFSDRILRPAFLRLATKGAINVHPAPLPKYRSPDPLYWQLIHGETQSAVTVHFISEIVDGGPIVAQDFFPLDDRETERTLRRKVDCVAPKTLLRAIDLFRTGPVTGIPQNEEDSTYFPERPKGWGVINPIRIPPADLKRATSS